MDTKREMRQIGEIGLGTDVTSHAWIAKNMA